MLKKNICQDIFIENNLLNGNMSSKIKEKIKELKSTCSFENGCIIDVFDDIEIIDNFVTEYGVFVKTQFSIKLFKPVLNEKYSCIVKLIYSQYILCSIFDKIDVLLDSNNIKTFKFNKASNSFLNIKNNEEEIKVGSTIEIKITIMKFVNQKFNCIGTLI